MNNDELIREVWQMYEKEMNSRNNADYEINEPQMRKLIDAYSFFVGVAERDGGRVESFKMIPKEISAGVTAYFTVFYLSGEDMVKFQKIIGDMSAISLDTTLDNEVCISFTIPKVFKRKQEAEI